MSSDEVADVERDHTFLAREDKQITNKFKAHVIDRLERLASADRSWNPYCVECARLTRREAKLF